MPRDKIIILCGFAAIGCLIILIIMKLFKIKKVSKIDRITFQDVILLLTAIAGVLFFLFSAPLMRYGVVFFLIPIAICCYYMNILIGEKAIRRYGTIGAILIAALWFVRQDDNFCLIEPQDYWKVNNQLIEWQGMNIFAAGQDQHNDYKDFPAIVSTYVLNEIEPRGKALQDGFRYCNKKEQVR